MSATASKTFARIWAQLDSLRVKKNKEPAALAKKCGFTRSTWFVYQKKGSIPFNILERLAHELDANISVSLVSTLPDAPDTKDEDITEGIDLSSDAEELLNIFEQLSEKEQGKLIGYAQSLTGRARPTLPGADARPGSRGT